MFWPNNKQFSKQVDSMLGKADSIQCEINLMRSYLRVQALAPAHGHASERGEAVGGGTPIHYSAPCPAGEGA